MFVKNCWYTAAWSHELDNTQPVARKIVGEPVVLFRTQSGKVAALEDRCKHRGLPLSVGELDHEIIRCGYHGLEFGVDGQCKKVPGQDMIPPTCRVKSYTVVERDSLVWIWMGEPAQADPDTIVPYPWHAEDSGWAWMSDTYEVECNYQLLHDNLLDLSHLGYVHKKTIGGDPNTHVNAEMKTTRVDTNVNVTRWMRDSTPPPTYVNAVGFEGKVDRWQEIGFWPGVLRIWTGATDAGQGAFEDESGETRRTAPFQLRIFDGITPIDEDRSYYFWSSAHNFRTDDPEVTKRVFDEIAMTFMEDKFVLEEQQKRIDDDPMKSMVDVNADIAGIQARRIITKLLEQERAAANVPEAAE